MDELQAALESLKAKLDEHEQGGKTLEQKRFICPGKDVTLGQSREVVLKFLRANPQELQLPFVLLAHLALATAFPCSGDSSPAAGAATPPPR